MRRLIAAAGALLAVVAPAQAAERRWPIGSVERLRVEAPVAVRVTTGAGTGVTATASDRAMLDALDVSASGGTLVIRWSAARRGRPATVADRLVVTVATPRLTGAALYAAAPVTVSAMRGDRVIISNAGAGTLDVARIDATELAATLAGEGTVTLAGRATSVRLVANGPAVLDAQALSADRLNVQASGDAVVRAAARFQAEVIATQAAQVDVAGRPQCAVRAATGSAVRCGAR